MLMKQFAGSAFITTAHVTDAPLRKTIAAVSVGKYDKPVLLFKSGDQLTLNATNTKTLIRAYGDDSDRWVGHTIELYLGESKFEGETKPSVKVRPLPDGPPAGSSENLDDDIPF
jgi:hypothetical protein